MHARITLQNGPKIERDAPLRITQTTPQKGRTQSGYGPALPTAYLVQLGDRWHRVKCAQWSNAGTMYIGKPGKWLAIINDIVLRD